ncbi:MAG: AsmA-like C-terminal domain-containing protein [Gammaproteobacteria bacterium]|nr:AsmA-like C-terminal domain-containing protein [Gammaproteobacteria bacterium]
MSSTARIALQALGALFGVLAILFGLAAWRLSTGPLSLGFLSPYIQEALEGEDLSYHFEFEDTVLVWPGWGEALEVHLTEVRIADTDGATLVAVPEASLGLSGAALLSGTLAPTSIELIGLSLALARGPDGKLRLAGDDETGVADDEATDSLVADLLDPPREDHPMSRLERVSLRDASIVLLDETTDLTWTAPSADLSLNLDDAAVLGHLSADVQVQDLKTHIEVELFHHRESKMGSAAIGFSGLNLVKLSFIAPELEEFAGLRVPLSGTIAFDVAPGGILSGVVFDITGGAGEIDWPAVFPKPVSVRRLVAAGSVDGELSRLVLDSFVVETDRPSISLDGELWQTSAGIGVRGRLQARDMPFDSLDNYWPETFIPPGRRWIVQNVTEGVITQYDVVLDIEPGDFENDRFSADSATGSLAFENANVHYLRPMPPVTGVSGSGRFNGESLHLTMSDGRIEGIVASRGTASLSGIHSAVPRMSVTIEAEGPAADALALLDHPRLGLVSKIGLEPAGVGGTVRTLFALELPMLKAIEPEQVDVNAVARVEDARIENVAGMTDMTEGALHVGVDNASMDLRGTARLQGMPATIAWHENFGDGAPFVRRFDVTTTVTSEAQAALGFDMAPYVEGTLGLVGGYTDPGDGEPPRATLAFDATEAQLEIPELHWAKPPGAPGAVRVVASLPSEDTVVLTRIELETETLYALGRATLEPELGGVHEITIETLQYGETDVAGRIESDAGSTRVSVRGARLDARPYLSRLTAEGAPEFGKLVLDLVVDSIVTTDDQQLTDFRARFETGAEGRYTGFMEGTLATGARMSFALEPGESERLITVRSRDAGAVARTFGIYDNAQEGDLLMEAVVHDDRPGAPVTGTVRIEDYRVIDAPTLARLLSVATLTGILGELRGKGIRFSRFEMPFSLEEHVLTIRDARTSGFTVGVNAEGTVDLESDRVDIAGTIVPAYTFNTLLDAIPILGELLTGGEGEGLFAATYRIGGTTSEPDISVNPLSVLAPGFLRKLFSTGEEGE